MWAEEGTERVGGEERRGEQVGGTEGERGRKGSFRRLLSMEQPTPIWTWHSNWAKPSAWQDYGPIRAHEP